MNKNIHPNSCLCLLAVMVLLSGCAANIQPRPEHLTFATPTGPVPHIPKKVALVLGDDFTGYVRRISVYQGTPFDLQCGPALEAYAKHTAETFFDSVEIVHGNEAVPAQSADFILTPRVLKSEVLPSVVMTAFQKRQLTLTVEWTLKRNGDNAALWMTTVKGQGEALSGAPELIERTVSDLWQQTIPPFTKMQTLERLQLK